MILLCYILFWVLGAVFFSYITGFHPKVVSDSTSDLNIHLILALPLNYGMFLPDRPRLCLEGGMHSIIFLYFKLHSPFTAVFKKVY
jgi:CDP-diglyceride synthetase